MMYALSNLVFVMCAKTPAITADVIDHSDAASYGAIGRCRVSVHSY